MSRGLRWSPFFLVALALCGGPGCSAPEQSSLTPEDQLPADHAAAWRAWYEQDPSWSEWRPRVAEDPALANFFVDNLWRVMVRHYDHAEITRASELPGPFERARRELLFLHDQSGPVCVELLVAADGVVSFLAGDLLLRMDEGRWTLPVARLLENERAEDRRRAAEWLGRLPFAGDDEAQVCERLASAAAADPEWFVRAQAVTSTGERALATGRLGSARPVLIRSLGDGDPAVVRAACEALGAGGDPLSVPALINLLERMERGEFSDLRTLEAVRAALGRLTGARDPVSVAEWRSWWLENRPERP